MHWKSSFRRINGYIDRQYVQHQRPSPLPFWGDGREIRFTSFRAVAIGAAYGACIFAVFMNKGVKNMAQKIEIVRGTTNTFQISINDANGAPYNLQSNEKVVFGIKKDLDDVEPLIIKTAEVLYEGMYSVQLSPEDTVDLDCGRYHYDVGVDNGTDFFNVIEPNLFVIVPNVTHRGCAG